MRIQHNIPAINAYRNFNINSSNLNKNLEKLSSGYKVNRAADDAAGLAVSEKMRAQITGLEGAQRNVKDGLNLIATAEGALQEVHTMLNRMYTLAEQSANGTYDNNIDRPNLQLELESLAKEIDRIGATSNYNGRKLFANSAAMKEAKMTGQTNMLSGSWILAIGENGEVKNKLTLFGSSTYKTSTAKTAFSYINSKLNSKISKSGLKAISASALGVGTAISIMTAGAKSGSKGAFQALDRIRGAVNAVSIVRGQLGAYQNRMEHASTNLGIMKENISDAESTIRDTDVAEEMMNFTKNNILNQAAQAMLAQANQLPQGVLQLLQ